VLATPIDGAPDELSHVVRAASVARGELLGQQRSGSAKYFRYVRVPGGLVKPGVNRIPHDPRLYVPCFAFHAAISAKCFGSLDGTSALQRTATDVGLDPPTFYAVVGLPSLAFHSRLAFYLMRMMSVFVCAALLASALSSVRSAQPSWLGAVGLAIAVTPTTLFLVGTVNPSGVEICAGIGAWASLLVLVRDRAAVIDRRLVQRAAIALTVLVLTRGLGLLWAALIMGFALAFGTREGLRRLMVTPVVRRWLSLVVVAATFAAAWSLAVRPLSHLYPHGAKPGPVSMVTIARQSFGDSNELYRQMVARFGWLDTNAPTVTYLLWTSALGLIVILALAYGTRRHVGLLAAVVALTIAVPVAIDSSQARRIGLGWQGRWTLPFAVGVPITAALILAWSHHADLITRTRLRGLLVGTLFAAQFLAFGQALRRNTVGSRGPLDFWLHPSWSPPLPAWLLLASYALALAALTAWIMRPDQPWDASDDHTEATRHPSTRRRSQDSHLDT